MIYLNRPITIGHRGSSGYEDEHTIESYQMALDMNADYLELDLQLTKDNVLICMHDTKVDRTTSGTGFINEMTLSEIKELKTTNGRIIPTLEDVISYFGNAANYYIELKYPHNEAMCKEFLRVLKKHRMIGQFSERKRIVVQSFSEESLKYVGAEYSNVALIKLTKEASSSEIQQVKDYCLGIAPVYTVITKEFVDEAHANGLLVHTWTINDQENLIKMKSMGVDGIFTNFPDTMKY